MLELARVGIALTEGGAFRRAQGALKLRTLNSPQLAVLYVKIHIQAKEPTAHEAAWSALVAAKKTEAAASPEALALKKQILAGPTITKMESVIVAEVETARGGMEAYKTTFREIAASAKAGDGVTRARTNVKIWDGDSTSWTDGMVASRYDLASALAMRPTATPEFKNQVWAVLKSRSAHPGSCRAFFKSQRATSPRPCRSR